LSHVQLTALTGLQNALDKTKMGNEMLTHSAASERLDIAVGTYEAFGTYECIIFGTSFDDKGSNTA
jgi:hypothetical protein